MNAQQAQSFADEWVCAWNAHDLDRTLEHYEDDFEMSSPRRRPVIIQSMNQPSGTLKGRELVAAYWRKALDRYPNLHFELLHVLAGANSVTIAQPNGALAHALQHSLH